MNLPPLRVWPVVAALSLAGLAGGTFSLVSTTPSTLTAPKTTIEKTHTVTVTGAPAIVKTSAKQIRKPKTTRTISIVTSAPRVRALVVTEPNKEGNITATDDFPNDPNIPIVGSDGVVHPITSATPDDGGPDPSPLPPQHQDMPGGVQESTTQAPVIPEPPADGGTPSGAGDASGSTVEPDPLPQPSQMPDAEPLSQ